MDDCIFCKFVRGEAPCHKIWEDEQHLAFLSIFPNTEGLSVVIPKQHYPSYAFHVADNVLQEMIVAVKKVAQLLDEKLEDVGRTGMIFEGLGVDHLHAKLFPMHGTAQMKEWRKLSVSLDKYFDHYEGYISSHDYKRADDQSLAELARSIRTE
jgi:diadenosine tetraphosphate (Ap4A) HIT family hydrolase